MCTNTISTIGQRLVGLNFNPSGNEDVNKAKQLCADLIDLLSNTENNSIAQADIKNRAIYDVLAAQMMVVKALTWQN